MRLAEDLLPPVTVQPFAGGVPARDIARGVQQAHRVMRQVLGEKAKAILAPAQLLFGPPATGTKRYQHGCTETKIKIEDLTRLHRHGSITL
jgi:hypothetical protein